MRDTKNEEKKPTPPEIDLLIMHEDETDSLPVDTSLWCLRQTSAFSIQREFVEM